jgi:sugar lactone lactonase YvrE
MLHESPDCMGIAWDHDNVYWVFDGYHDALVYYDFQQDHGYGGDDHSDGIVRRYADVGLKRVEGVPGHLVLDPTTGWLYIADTGTGRVLRFDTASGEYDDDLRQKEEPLQEYSKYKGGTVEVFADGFQEPSGIELYEDRLFVSDHATGEIVAFDLDGNELGRIATGAEGIMGLDVGPDDKLWYADGKAETVDRVDP